MSEREPRRMQELPLQTEIVSDPVHPVTRDGKADRLEVHPDLVRPPGLEANAQKRSIAQLPLDREVRDRVARRRRIDRMPGRLMAVSADRRLDPARPRARVAAHE